VTCAHLISQFFSHKVRFFISNVYTVSVIPNMYSPSTKMAEVEKLGSLLQNGISPQRLQLARFSSLVISAKMGTSYLDLELGNEFWNRVWVPSSWYKSLVQQSSASALLVRPQDRLY